MRWVHDASEKQLKAPIGDCEARKVEKMLAAPLPTALYCSINRVVLLFLVLALALW